MIIALQVGYNKRWPKGQGRSILVKIASFVSAAVIPDAICAGEAPAARGNAIIRTNYRRICKRKGPDAIAPGSPCMNRRVIY
jgi:hypothetical protein